MIYRTLQRTPSASTILTSHPETPQYTLYLHNNYSATTTHLPPIVGGTSELPRRYVGGTPSQPDPIGKTWRGDEWAGCDLTNMLIITNGQQEDDMVTSTSIGRYGKECYNWDIKTIWQQNKVKKIPYTRNTKSYATPKAHIPTHVIHCK